jgi:phosphoglycolate phosphatase
MKAVIFDFDGTIADNFSYVHEIVTKLAPKYGFTSKDADEVVGLRDLSMKQIVERYKVSRFNVFRMLLDGRKEMKRHLPDSKMPAGLVEVLRDLEQSGLKLAIISSNSESSIRNFLDNNHLGVKVDIYSSVHLFGKHKAITRYMQKHKFTCSDVVYIGDEVRDIDAARQAGIPIISVTWGYNDRRILAEKNMLIADKPADLVDLIERASA